MSIGGVVAPVLADGPAHPPRRIAVLPPLFVMLRTLISGAISRLGSKSCRRSPRGQRLKFLTDDNWHRKMLRCDVDAYYKGMELPHDFLCGGPEVGLARLCQPELGCELGRAQVAVRMQGFVQGSHRLSEGRGTVAKQRQRSRKHVVRRVLHAKALALVVRAPADPLPKRRRARVPGQDVPQARLGIVGRRHDAPAIGAECRAVHLLVMGREDGDLCSPLGVPKARRPSWGISVTKGTSLSLVGTW